MAFKKPTDEEWEKIKGLMLNPDDVPREKVGVVKQRMADNKRTSYDTILSMPILKKFGQDVSNGVDDKQIPLMFNHPSLSGALPLGVSFDSEVRIDKGRTNELGDPVTEVFGSFYTVDGTETIPLSSGGIFGDTSVSSVTTEDISNKYNAGLIKGGSVGFRTSYVYCSICGKHPSHSECDHTPGSEYKGKMAAIVVGSSEPGSDNTDGYLVEYSLVMKGAVASAGAVTDYSCSDDQVVTMQFDSFDPSTVVPRHDKTGCDNNKTDMNVEESLMEITQEKYDELIKSKMEHQFASRELASLKEEIESLKTQLSDGEEVSVKLAEANEKLSGMEEQVKVYSEMEDSLREALKESRVQAYGQDSDHKFTDVGSMSADEMLAEYRENIKLFFSVVPDGSASENQGVYGSVSRQVAAFIVNKGVK